MDETAVSTEFVQPVKVFGAADTKHGGFRAAPASGSSKHITAVVAVSASGRKPPPFFIVAGKNIMSGWKKPLHMEELRFTERLEWFLSE